MTANPVLRYSDEEHRVPDATLWCWTYESRPVAFQKVEGNNWGGGQQWTICFTSLSVGLLNVHWPANRSFVTRKPGIQFRPITGADAPAEVGRSRTAQLKIIKDRFTARTGINEDRTGGAETRTMPKPLYEYSDPESKLPLGAIFGMSSTGTNPSLLLIIEARPNAEGKLGWEYGLARMTSFSVQARLDEDEIWYEKDATQENWTAFFLKRDFQ